MAELSAKTAAKLATRIVVAYLARATIEPHQLPRLVGEISAALVDGRLPPHALEQPDAIDLLGSSVQSETSGDSNPETSEGPAPAVDLASTAPAATTAEEISGSIHDEYLVSFEDGKRYRTLRRHLMAKYGMTPEQYRIKWGLPNDYPMVAPSYARDRSQVAIKIGLGRRVVEEVKPARKASAKAAAGKA